MKHLSTETKSNATPKKCGVSLLLTIILLLIAMLSLAACGAGEESDGVLTYGEIGGELLVTGLKADLDPITSSNIIIPATYNDKKVAGIYKEAFKDSLWISSVVFSSGAVSIGNKAFQGCTSLGSVVLPDTLELISAEAFMGCTNLTYVDMPALNALGDYAFAACKSLAEINLPASLKTLGSYVFEGDEKLAAVNAAAGTAFESADGVLYNARKTKLVYYPEGRTNSEFTVPATVESIGVSAFQHAQVTSVTLSQALVAIEGFAFYGSSVLSLIITANVIAIAPSALTANGSTRFSVEQGNTVFTADGDGLLYKDGWKTLVKVPTTISVSVPASVTEIGAYAFYGCVNIGTVNIPSGVTKIGALAFTTSHITGVTIPDSVVTLEGYAFSGCTRLQTVTIGSGLKNIPEAAFINCEALTSVTFSEGLETLGKAAFSLCPSIESVVLPSTVTRLDEMVFYPGEKLISVTLLSTTPPMLAFSVFSNLNPDFVITVPAQSVEAYRTATNWSAFASRIAAASVA
ncbi:MAG: leucine-rich repeat domain-containing protein [Clostridiaceae bacterium]|jgi:hypothetical protein|nr:leucine-rich repeat domain-containing protein [Clostridiaceae bacterium]